jgi:5'-nucleotidase/UDP-sugar diphosphatase
LSIFKSLAMKFTKASLVVVVLLLYSCSKNGNKIQFTFLQLNDVYQTASIQGGEFSGMASAETSHQELLKETNIPCFLW